MASDLESRVASLERRLEDVAGAGASADDSGLVGGRKTGASDASMLKKVSTRLQD
eukprot:CAMPEP_0198496204 /NCGR_PEP_ID=MMETSP1462-20131121/5685_1 /TAXON_ID=1333877 /ORGANISM="Brandtodinium nutriculum, Strain RCC3387" /LENGTH=54 /DNA_ID=CAMNT_0044225023 /DNA_START=93 /DNA_END=254 /DNA_ORIENTATION=+